MSKQKRQNRVQKAVVETDEGLMLKNIVDSENVVVEHILRKHTDMKG